MPRSLFPRLLSLTLLAFLAAASVSHAAAPKWTILIYGHGDHNLSPALVKDFLEMQKVGSSADFHIVLQTDFDQSNEGTYDAGLPREFGRGMTRWLVSPSKANEVVSQVLERGPELDSDRGTNLAAFIRWGLQNHPADRYGLILWDHGSSWLGFGGDQQDGTKEDPNAMGLNEITSGIQNGMAGLLNRFDFLSFDACLMANQEVFSEMAPFCGLYIANAEIDYGPGWDYDGALGWLKANPAATMRNFARAEAKTYRDHHDSELDKFFMAHVALDTAPVDAFRSAAAQFAASLRRHFSEEVARAQRRAPTYVVGDFEPGPVGKADSAYVDLPRMARVLSRDRLVPRSLRFSARRVLSAFHSLREAEVMGVQKRLAGGMNVYLPLSKIEGDRLSHFANLQADATFQWSRVIRAAQRAGRSHRETPEFVPPAAISGTVGQPVGIDLSLRKGRPFAIAGNLLDRDGTNSLGEAGRLVVGGLRRDYHFAWDPRVFQVATPGGYRVLPAFQQQESLLWVVAVQFSDPALKGETSTGTIVLALEGNKVRLVQAMGGPTSVAPRGFVPTPGTIITPLRIAKEEALPGTWSFVVPAEGLSKIPVRLAPLPAGTYTIAFEAEDAFGHVSKTVNQRVQLK